MSDIWMASKGLEVSFEDERQEPEEFIKAKLGDLEGQFIEYSSKSNRIVFETNNTSLAFEYISNLPKDITITYGDIVHEFDWKSYNYKIQKGSKQSLSITIEEKHE